METKINLRARANDAALIIRPERMLLSVITSPKGCQSGWGGSLETRRHSEKADC